MKKIIILFMVLMIMALLSVSAYAYPITVRLHSDVGNFHTSVYKCSGPGCDSYYFYSHSYGNPTMYVLHGYGKQYFVEYDYKNCYLGQAWTVEVSGKTCNGPRDFDIDFVKENNCRASIKSLLVSDSDIVVGESVTFTALINSAVDYEDNKPLPPSNLIVPHYSSHVDTFIYINGELIDTQALDIPFGEDESVSYNYQFTQPGTYEVSVYTKLDNDCKCTDSAWRQKTIIITVTEQEECTCTDSDGGKNYGVQGTVTRECIVGGEFPTSSIVLYTDECAYCTGLLPAPVTCGAVKEYYCEGTEVKSETYVCPSGFCEDGACIETECTPGETRQCGETDEGECDYGIETCDSEGIWGECIGAVYPVDEVCDDELDNDCDGFVDEDCEEECTPGETRSCGDTDEGECEFGIQTCQECSTWGECIGAVYPVDEVCDGLDNDCDGYVDESLAIACDYDCDCPEDGYYEEEYRDYYCYMPGTCFSQCLYNGIPYECTPGETRACGLTDTGICTIGYEECVSGFWSDCIGAIYPEEYEICGNKMDDNCNGFVDEDCYDPEVYPREVLSINKLSVFNDCALPGTDFPVLISFKNTASYELKGLRVMGVIDELNDLVRMGPFNLDQGEEEVKLLFFNIPSNAREGEYTITVIVSNDDIKRIKHRTFRVDRQCPYMAYECCGV